MTVNKDSATTPEPDTAAEADTERARAVDVGGEAPAAAKPVRRKRAVKVVAERTDDLAGDAAVVASTSVDEAPPVAESDVDTAPPPAKRTRRRKAVESEASGEAGEPPSEAPVTMAPEVAPIALSADAEAPLESAEVAPTGDDVSAAPPADGEGAAGDVARKNRRRSRRERRRARQNAVGTELPLAAGESEEDDDEGEGDGSADGEREPVDVVAPEPPTNPDELFAEVLSGQFDVNGEPPAEDAAASPPKRVLRPEPDAPKLHKVLAQAGIGSRRDMEQAIADGQVTVNGQPAHVGQRISFGDQIKVGGKAVRVRIVPPAPRIIAYHKPVGEVVTNDDPEHRPTVFRRLPRLQQGKWQSVGRLDLNTEGLLLFTNSGELANQLMHPRFGVEREYAVRVLGALDEDDKADLLEGVEIDGQTCSFRSIQEGGGEGANRWYRVVITEGRNREVRKLFEAIDLTVSRLIRIRYGTVVLPRGLKRGVWVDLQDDDVRAIRRLAAPEGRERNDGPRQDQGRNDSGRNDGQRGDARGRGKPPQQQRNGPPDRNNAPRGRNGRADEAPRHQPPPQEEVRARDRNDDDEEEIDHSRIPNPLEQTFDKRFVQNPRTPAGGRGFGRGGGGFGGGGSSNANATAPRKPGAPREPDPLQTSVGYIGADAFHRKVNRNKGGGGQGGGGGGFGRGGQGGGGGGGGGGGRRGGR